MKQGKVAFKLVAVSVVTVFISTLVMVDLLRCRKSEAAELGLPQPGTLLTAGVVHQAPLMKGVRFNPNDPLNLEFIFDSGSDKAVDQSQARQLIEYFIAGLLVPESDLWVNLSPYESDRVVPQKLGETALGRDMLATDYVLKQLASSLTHPDSETGKAYWATAEGDAFSKVWVMPDAANMIDADTAGYIIDATLKVMTEADYTAMQNSDVGANDYSPLRDTAMSALLPAITSDVNEGKNFEQLRQIYHSLLLATWFKKKFMNTFYKQYFDSTAVEGVESGDPNARKNIYDLYVSAFKKGAYDLYKKERNETGRVAKHRYFSGGAVMNNLFEATQYKPVGADTKNDFVRSIDGNSFACSAVVLESAQAVSRTSSSAIPTTEQLKDVLFSDIGAASLRKFLGECARDEIAKLPKELRMRMLIRAECAGRDYYQQGRSNFSDELWGDIDVSALCRYARTLLQSEAEDERAYAAEFLDHQINQKVYRFESLTKEQQAAMLTLRETVEKRSMKDIPVADLDSFTPQWLAWFKLHAQARPGSLTDEQRAVIEAHVSEEAFSAAIDMVLRSKSKPTRKIAIQAALSMDPDNLQHLSGEMRGRIAAAQIANRFPISSRTERALADGFVFSDEALRLYIKELLLSKDRHNQRTCLEFNDEMTIASMCGVSLAKGVLEIIGNEAFTGTRIRAAFISHVRAQIVRNEKGIPALTRALHAAISPDHLRQYCTEGSINARVMAVFAECYALINSRNYVPWNDITKTGKKRLVAKTMDAVAGLRRAWNEKVLKSSKQSIAQLLAALVDPEDVEPYFTQPAPESISERVREKIDRSLTANGIDPAVFRPADYAALVTLIIEKKDLFEKEFEQRAFAKKQEKLIAEISGLSENVKAIYSKDSYHPDSMEYSGDYSSTSNYTWPPSAFVNAIRVAGFIPAAGKDEVLANIDKVIRVHIPHYFEYYAIGEQRYKTMAEAYAAVQSSEQEPGKSVSSALLDGANDRSDLGGISLRETAEVKVAPYAGPMAVPAGLKGAMSVFTLSDLRQVAAGDVIG